MLKWSIKILYNFVAELRPLYLVFTMNLVTLVPGYFMTAQHRNSSGIRQSILSHNLLVFGHRIIAFDFAFRTSIRWRGQAWRKTVFTLECLPFPSLHSLTIHWLYSSEMQLHIKNVALIRVNQSIAWTEWQNTNWCRSLCLHYFNRINSTLFIFFLLNL